MLFDEEEVKDPGRLDDSEEVSKGELEVTNYQEGEYSIPNGVPFNDVPLLRYEGGTTTIRTLPGSTDDGDLILNMGEDELSIALSDSGEFVEYQFEGGWDSAYDLLIDLFGAHTNSGNPVDTHIGNIIFDVEGDNDPEIVINNVDISKYGKQPISFSYLDINGSEKNLTVGGYGSRQSEISFDELMGLFEQFDPEGDFPNVSLENISPRYGGR